MEETTVMIVSACKQVVQSYHDYQNGMMTSPENIDKAIDEVYGLIEKTRKAAERIESDMVH